MSKNIAIGGLSQFAGSVTLSANDIDWSQGNVFSKTLSTNATFTFSNSTDGRTIVLKITNTSASPLTLTFPAAVVSPDNTVLALKTKIYTFVNIAGVFYTAATEF